MNYKASLATKRTHLNTTLSEKREWIIFSWVLFSIDEYSPVNICDGKNKYLMEENSSLFAQNPE